MFGRRTRRTIFAFFVFGTICSTALAGGSSSPWQDDESEIMWFKFSVLCVLILVGSLFEYIDHTIAHNLASDVGKEKQHIDFSNDFWSILLRSFHAEVSVVGFLAFIVWVIRRTETLDYIITDDTYGKGGPADRVTFEHYVEDIHMYLFISMLIHIAFTGLFTFYCDSIYLTVLNYGLSNKNERVMNKKYAKFYKMDLLIQDYFKNVFPEQEVDFPPYMLSKIRRTIVRLVQYNHVSWLSVCLIFAIWSGAFYRFDTDSAKAICAYMYTGFTAVLLLVLLKISSTFKKRIERKSWDGNPQSRFTDNQMIHFFQFAFFFQNFFLVFNCFNYHDNSYLVFISYAVHVITIPKLLSHSFIFVMSLPPYFDADDLHHMIKTSQQVAIHGYGDNIHVPENRTNKIAPVDAAGDVEMGTIKQNDLTETNL